MPDRRAGIDHSLCQNCSVCPAMEGCPTKSLIRLDPDEPPVADSTCRGCGTCTRQCPYRAISLV